MADVCCQSQLQNRPGSQRPVPATRIKANEGHAPRGEARKLPKAFFPYDVRVLLSQRYYENERLMPFTERDPRYEYVQERPEEKIDRDKYVTILSDWEKKEKRGSSMPQIRFRVISSALERV